MMGKNYKEDKSQKTQRYHIWIGTKRTTVSLDNILSEALSIQMGFKPYTDEAQAAVRDLAQKWIDKRQDDPNQVRVSQWVRYFAILAIMDEDLRLEHGEWFLNRNK